MRYSKIGIKHFHKGIQNNVTNVIIILDTLKEMIAMTNVKLAVVYYKKETFQLLDQRTLV